MFDIDAVFSSMAGAIQSTVANAWPQAQTVWVQFAQTNKDTLQDIAMGIISKDITIAEAQSYMDDMKNTLQTQLLASPIMAEAVAQAPANTPLDIYWPPANTFIGLKTT